MRRALGFAALGIGLLILAPFVGGWMLFRECQWQRDRKWHGHYDQPVEGWRMAERAEDGTEYVSHNDSRWAA